MIYLKYLSILSFIVAMLLELAGIIWISQLYTACQNMQNVQHKLLKQIILRFTNCARLDIGICSTPSFVKKYISNYTLAGLHYTSFEKFSVSFCIIGLVLTTYGTLVYSEAYYKYALISILFSAIYILFYHLVDTDDKLEQTAALITDYLDNTLNHRLITTANAASRASAASAVSAAAAATAAKQETAAADIPAASNNMSDKKDVSKKNQEIDSDEIIFSVINDFLV